MPDTSSSESTRQVADAIRSVTVSMQSALENGERSYMIDASDLLDILLALADQLDPSV